MKKSLISIMFVPVLFSGCLLAPKPVEFFQKEVQAVPVATRAQADTEKQAAARAALKAHETWINAIKEGSSSAVTVPAQETAALTEAVTDSLGPPSQPWEGSTVKLVEKVDANIAKLDRKLDKYREDVAPLVGKDIEGTGLFSVGYFTMWFLALAVIALIWVAFKVWGMINPVVGLGVNTAGRVASTVVNKGFSEVVAGGNKFSRWIGEHSAPTLTKDEVLELFTSAHKEEQSREVRQVVRNLTDTK